MIIKRIILIFTLALTVFTLSACNEAAETKVYTLSVTSNIDEVTPIYFDGNIVDRVQAYVISTYPVEGYTFEYWHIEGNTEQLSTELSYNYTPTADSVVEAYYSNDNPDPIDPVVDVYTVTVTTNVETINVAVSHFPTNSGATQYKLIAPVIGSYTFLHWMDINTEAILSSDLTFTFVATMNQEIEAIYELDEIAEPELFYETMFDDASKAAYAEGTVTTGGKDLILKEALLGTLSADQKISGSSVRMKQGHILTDFTITDIAQIVFYAGIYGADDSSTVNVQLSTDKITWITVDTFTSSATLDLYSYIFDDTLVTSLGIDTSNAFYFRIANTTGERVNVDNLQIYTGEGFIADDTPLYTITITNMATQYLLNETVDLSGCVATHPTSGATTCDVTGTVNTSIGGAYEVIFSKTDEFGNTAVEIVRFTVIDPVAIGDITTDMVAYYDDAEGLYGDALITALNIILNTGFSGVDYGAARTILDDSDQDPLNANNLILVYLGSSISGVWDSGATWNREHVWPQSLLGESASNGTVNVASDLYNLMPADPGENSTRSNQPYSALVSGYEPRDEVKGDVARALFYMMVMYDNLNLVNTAPGLYEMGYLDELIAWHIADPVSQFEIDRLEVIANAQNNRNPFVDYPHLVDLVFLYEVSGD